MPEQENQKIKELLEKIPNISYKENINGEEFNIFEIVGISTKEVYMCRLLAELLDPNGLHGQNTKYLDLFCEKFLPDMNINTQNVTILKEDLTRNLEETKNKRRIDIVIDELDGYYIPIEVKINACEQKDQCLDYLKSARIRYKERPSKKEDEAIIIYLTKHAEMPTSIQLEEDKKKVKCISWSDIVEWLGQCICQIETIRKPYITEIMLQLKFAIEKFINGGQKMDDELYKLLIENLDSAEVIENNVKRAKKQLWNEFKNDIAKKLEGNEQKIYKGDYIITILNEECKEGNVANYKVISYEDNTIWKLEAQYKSDNGKLIWIKQISKEKEEICKFNQLGRPEERTNAIEQSISYLSTKN